MQTIPVESLAHCKGAADAQETLPQYTVEQFLAAELAPELLAHALSDDLAQRVCEALKRESDRYWYIDPDRSLRPVPSSPRPLGRPVWEKRYALCLAILDVIVIGVASLTAYRLRLATTTCPWSPVGGASRTSWSSSRWRRCGC